MTESHLLCVYGCVRVFAVSLFYRELLSSYIFFFMSVFVCLHENPKNHHNINIEWNRFLDHSYWFLPPPPPPRPVGNLGNGGQWSCVMQSRNERQRKPQIHNSQNDFVNFQNGLTLNKYNYLTFCYDINRWRISNKSGSFKFKNCEIEWQFQELFISLFKNWFSSRNLVSNFQKWLIRSLRRLCYAIVTPFDAVSIDLFCYRCRFCESLKNLRLEHVTMTTFQPYY